MYRVLHAKALIVVGTVCLAAVAAGHTAELTQQAIDEGSFSERSEAGTSASPDPFLIRVQVLLDRAAVSPGVIDGFMGDNLTKAIRTFQERAGLEPKGKIDEKFWAALSKDSAPVLQSYKITKKDLSERYVEHIPKDYAEMAKLKWLGYTGPKEMLAERFHMDQSLLERLNPNVDFTASGTKILVASPGENATEKVSRIVVDRSEGELFAFAKDQLVVSYPATIGSKSNPSPSGKHKIKAIVLDPSYTYDPEKNFQQGENSKPLEIPPGPNGPVGSVWIDLTEPTYGIHGTAEPDLVDKTVSHGCVRLTNWDAKELAHLVAKGTPVEFRE
jgi:lipoprotein-anchoring transpeptidase ErfK/SrfK